MAGGRVSRAGWASQPQYPVQIDWENPDTRDLRFFYTGSMPVDLVTGQTATIVGGAAPRTVNAGQGAAIGPDISDTSYIDFVTRESWNITGAITVFWRGIFDVLGGNFRCALSKQGDNITNIPLDFFVDWTTSRLTFVRAGASNRRVWQTVETATAGQISAIGYTQDGLAIEAQPYMYLNNAIRISPSDIDGTGTGLATGNTSPLRIGRRIDGGTQLDGVPEVTMFWARALSTEEYGRVFRNPYSLLKSVRRRTGIIYGAGGAAFNPAWARGSNQLIGSGLYAS